MADTLWRRMVVVDGINWFKKLWFCQLTGIHKSKFVFLPVRNSPGNFYPSHRCELCDKDLFQ
jgi:hypothetical protein